MEAGTHSPWVSRYLEGLGWEVIVSNPRKVRAIYQHERKSDQRDALMLARIGRMDRALLYPVRHGSEEAQQDLLIGQDKGQTVPRDTRFTRVWVKQQGRWWLVANHYSSRITQQ